MLRAQVPTVAVQEGRSSRSSSSQPPTRPRLATCPLLRACQCATGQGSGRKSASPRPGHVRPTRSPRSSARSAPTHCSAPSTSTSTSTSCSPRSPRPCSRLRARLRGYHAATPDTIQRRFLETPGQIITTSDLITVRLERRAYTPVLRKASLPAATTIPRRATAPCATSSPNLAPNQLRGNPR